MAEPKTPAEAVAVLKSNAELKEKMDACRRLAIVGTKEAVPTLAALLGDEKLAHMARYAMEPIADPSVDAALLAALDKLEGRLLVGVIGSIGVRRDPKAVEPLTHMLHNEDPLVAQAAARSLGRLATPEAVEYLTGALTKAPAALRPAVADACLGCAESLLAAGERSEAAAIYQSVGKAELPKHFRVAATHGAIQARKSAETP